MQELNQMRFKRDLTLEERLKELASIDNENLTPEIQNIQASSSNKWSEFIENEVIVSEDEETEVQKSPPKKKVKLSLERVIDKPDPIKFLLTDDVSAKKTQKRHLPPETDIFNTPSKYTKLNNAARFSTSDIESVNKSVNKWLHYINEDERNDNETNKYEEIDDKSRNTNSTRF